MALTNLIFGPTRVELGEKDGFLFTTSAMTLDCSVSESHDRSSIVTDNEVEDGASVTDHVRLNPIKLTIEGIITDSPISAIQSLGGLVAETFAQKKTDNPVLASLAASGAGSVIGLLFNSDRSPEAAFEALEELWQKREPFKVVTKLKRYESMVIESLTAPRSKEVGRALRFTMALKQIRILKKETVSIAGLSVSSDVRNTAGKNASLGGQGTTESTGASSEKAGSLISQLTGLGK